MTEPMHHRKRGAKMPWTGIFKYPGLEPFRRGTVYTVGHKPKEARKLLLEQAAKTLPPGYELGWYGRGALIYQPQDKMGDGHFLETTDHWAKDLLDASEPNPIRDTKAVGDPSDWIDDPETGEIVEGRLRPA